MLLPLDSVLMASFNSSVVMSLLSRVRYSVVGYLSINLSVCTLSVLLWSESIGDILV